ncbi:MAG: hypothetical protein K0S61_4073 [Anaerocolumna sp.]|nr:hypothetical protein [Anaerocolumna sp.]
MDGMNDKYIYLIYKMVRNTNIDYLDNYLSIKKCAKCFVWIPAIMSFIGIIINFKKTEIQSIIVSVVFLWCYYGLFALIFFIRASEMKAYNEYYENLYENTIVYDNPIQEDNIDDYVVENYICDEEAQIKFKVVSCNSCGAKKQISVGRKEKCDYCDSPLEAEF